MHARVFEELFVVETLGCSAGLFGIPVIVTNQVMSHRGAAEGQAGTMSAASSHDVAQESETLSAALGTAWHHAINTRLMLELRQKHGPSPRLQEPRSRRTPSALDALQCRPPQVAFCLPLSAVRRRLPPPPLLLLRAGAGLGGLKARARVV